MVTTRVELEHILDAGNSSGSPSDLALRLLDESEIDWVSGGDISYSRSGTVVYAMGGGSGHYSQSGGSFTQSGNGSFSQDSGVAEMKMEPEGGGGGGGPST